MHIRQVGDPGMGISHPIFELTVLQLHLLMLSYATTYVYLVQCRRKVGPLFLL